MIDSGVPVEAALRALQSMTGKSAYETEAERASQYGFHISDPASAESLMAAHPKVVEQARKGELDELGFFLVSSHALPPAQPLANLPEGASMSVTVPIEKLSSLSATKGPHTISNLSEWSRAFSVFSCIVCGRLPPAEAAARWPMLTQYAHNFVMWANRRHQLPPAGTSIASAEPGSTCGVSRSSWTPAWCTRTPRSCTFSDKPVTRIGRITRKRKRSCKSSNLQAQLRILNQERRNDNNN